jgi:hypothetical protein
MGLALTIVPLLVITGLSWSQIRKSAEVSTEESRKLSTTDLDHITKGVYSMCEAQHALIE